MASLLYKYSFTTRLYDIDAAGVVFFARFLYFAHDAYETFLEHHKQSVKNILNSDFILPICHTEADFKTPVFLNESITIEISLQDINETEFTLSYHFLDKAKKLRATALTKHVCVDKNMFSRKTLPHSIRSLLNSGS